MKIIKTNLIILLVLLFCSQQAVSQIIAPTGISTRASSQLISYYDVEGDDAAIQVTNTNDTEGVWIHVQIFRSFDPDGGGPLDPVICDERDFVDFLTPNDTHVYDLEIDNFPRNQGETNAASGLATTFTDIDDTLGFVVITPVQSNVDLTAISFQHLTGTVHDDEDDDTMNLMGRDAVDFTTGEIVMDGTPLDGISNGFVVLQPEELLFNFVADDDSPDSRNANVLGIVFQDQYGPAGLLGYTVLPGEATWTPFIFDYNEDPTSCGITIVSCFAYLGINESFDLDNTELGDIDLCSGTTTPEYPAPGGTIGVDDPFTQEFFGWARIFVSGLDDFENLIGIIENDDAEGIDYMHVKGVRTDINPAENCAVAGDEDGDMSADCADPDCDGMMGPNGEICEAVEATCDDGADNDGDGATDGADTDCDGSESCPSCESGDQCSDGEDNDGDGNSDCADGGCDGATGPNGETCEAGVELTCNDNQDNDGDGTADCDDPDCAIATNCIAGEGGGGGGCSVASTASPSMLNFLLPMLAVGLVIGIRRKR